MKFYSLMKEHENDLARIIVSPSTFIVEAPSQVRSQTLENGKALAEAKVRVMDAQRLHPMRWQLLERKYIQCLLH